MAITAPPSLAIQADLRICTMELLRMQSVEDTVLRRLSLDAVRNALKNARTTADRLADKSISERLGEVLKAIDTDAARISFSDLRRTIDGISWAARFPTPG